MPHRRVLICVASVVVIVGLCIGAFVFLREREKAARIEAWEQAVLESDSDALRDLLGAGVDPDRPIDHDVAFAALPMYPLFGMASLVALAPLLLLPVALRLERVVATHTDGPALNDALAGTARLGFGFCVLLAAGWVLG